MFSVDHLHKYFKATNFSMTASKELFNNWWPENIVCVCFLVTTNSQLKVNSTEPECKQLHQTAGAQKNVDRKNGARPACSPNL